MIITDWWSGVNEWIGTCRHAQALSGLLMYTHSILVATHMLTVLVRPWLSSACGRSERHAASEGDGDLVSLHIRCVIDELDEKLCS